MQSSVALAAKHIEPNTTSLEILPMPAKLLPFFKGSMPLPPSVDNAYKRVTYRNKAGQTINTLGPSPALEQFKVDAAWMLTQAYADWNIIESIREKSKFKVPLAIQLRVYFSTEWKRDLDGVFKFAIDAAFSRMQLNDNLIVHIEAEKLVDANDPRVEIEVRCVVR